MKRYEGKEDRFIKRAEGKITEVFLFVVGELALLCVAAVLFFKMFCITAYADEVIPASEFEDENFYKYVLDNFDTNGDGVLMQSEADTALIISLRADNIKNVQNIKGIEYLHNLVSVDISENKLIEDVSSLLELSGLSTLDIGNTGVSDINFLSNMSLMALTINITEEDECIIKDFSPISNLKELTFLQLNYQYLGDISFLTELTKLEYVELSNTGIKDISPLEASKTNIISIDLSENELSDLSLISEMTFLQVLYLDENRPRLTELPDMTEMEQLQYVQLNGNSIPEEEMRRKLPAQIISSDEWVYLVASQIIEETSEIFIDNSTSRATENNTFENLNQGGENAQGNAGGLGGNAGNSNEEMTTLIRKTIISVLDNGIAAIGEFDEGVYLEGRKIEDTAQYQAMLDKIYESLEDIIKNDIYDIALYKDIEENGKKKKQKVQPVSMVEIVIDLDEKIEGKYHVFRQEEDGSITELQCFVEDGKLHFYSEHFSIFTIIITKLFGGEEESTSDKADGESTIEDTKKEEMRTTGVENTEDTGDNGEKMGKKGGMERESIIRIIAVAGVMAVIIAYEAVRRKKLLQLGNLISNKDDGENEGNSDMV